MKTIVYQVTVDGTVVFESPSLIDTARAWNRQTILKNLANVRMIRVIVERSSLPRE